MSINISPRVFFFDFDGVIVDSERVHMRATLEVLKSHGIQFTEKEYFTDLLGFDDIGLFQFLFKSKTKFLPTDLLRTLIQNKSKIFLEIMSTETTFFDGAISLMERLHEKNIPMAIVSGALEREIICCLKQKNLEHFFKFIVAADHVKASKPDPESYLLATEKMQKIYQHEGHENYYVLEDSPAGIHSAREAGLKIIGITNSVHARELSKADFIISHTQEICIEN